MTEPMTRERRSLRLVGATGALRTAEFMGRPHMVVPVVMLIGDEVIFAQNAEGPEFIPAAEIARSVNEWNGRPVVGDHPQRDNVPVSANDPDIYERAAFGRLVAPRWENNRLLADAWLDPERAAVVGPDAVSVCERAIAAKPVEVSVGTWVSIERIDGMSATGKEYTGVWRDIGSDHLAMLPEGVIGACSNEMGCGAPRVARRHLVTATGLTVADEQGSAQPKARSTDRTVLDGQPATDISAVSEVSMQDTWRRFAERLSSLFAAAATDEEDPKLSPDPAPAETEARAACSCRTTNPSAASAKEEATMKQLAERIKALTENKKVPFDEAAITAMSENQIAALEAAFTPAVTPTPEKPPEATPVAVKPPDKEEDDDKLDPDAVTVSKDELASLRRAAKQFEAIEQKRKAQLVAQLAGAQKHYSEARLTTMSVEQLEEVQALISAVTAEPADYTGARGLAADYSAGLPELPDPWGLNKAKGAN